MARRFGGDGSRLGRWSVFIVLLPGVIGHGDRDRLWCRFLVGQLMARENGDESMLCVIVVAV
ncbi:hypothetical protein Dimus_029220 [Dionaea muscipula]